MAIRAPPIEKVQNIDVLPEIQLYAGASSSFVPHHNTFPLALRVSSIILGAAAVLPVRVKRRSHVHQCEAVIIVRCKKGHREMRGGRDRASASSLPVAVVLPTFRSKSLSLSLLLVGVLPVASKQRRC